MLRRGTHLGIWQGFKAQLGTGQLKVKVHFEQDVNLDCSKSAKGRACVESISPSLSTSE